MRRSRGVIITGMMFFVSQSQGWTAPTSTLTLDEFLQQVRSNHLGYRAIQETSTGSLLRAEEPSLLFSPTFFSTLQWTTDSKQNPFFSYEKLISNTYSVGFSQNTRFGLQAKLYYNLYYTNYVGLKPSYYEGRSTLELTQSFLRNGFGAEMRALEEAQRSLAISTHHGENYKMKLLLTEAENAYWRLQFARRHILIQKEAFERAQKIYHWSEKRARLRLSDSADLLQAQAALETKKLQLEAAVNEERSAMLNFNQMRESDQPLAPESLQEVSLEQLYLLHPPQKAKIREDIQAIFFMQRASFYNAEVNRERDKPTLEAFGSLSYNSRNTAASDALKDSLKTNQPTTAIGLRFTAPLDFGTIKASREGWEHEQKGSELLYQKKIFDWEREWADLIIKFEEAKNRLRLAHSIEEVQKQKLLHEKNRLNRGRTTTYQVLLFEQDFAQSQINRLQIQTELLQVYARLKLYGEGS